MKKAILATLGVAVISMVLATLGMTSRATAVAGTTPPAHAAALDVRSAPVSGDPAALSTAAPAAALQDSDTTALPMSCSGDDCGCNTPTCGEQCAVGDTACFSACRRDQLACAKACCAF